MIISKCEVLNRKHTCSGVNFESTDAVWIRSNNIRCFSHFLWYCFLAPVTLSICFKYGCCAFPNNFFITLCSFKSVCAFNKQYSKSFKKEIDHKIFMKYSLTSVYVQYCHIFSSWNSPQLKRVLTLEWITDRQSASDKIPFNAVLIVPYSGPDKCSRKKKHSISFEKNVRRLP